MGGHLKTRWGLAGDLRDGYRVGKRRTRGRRGSMRERGGDEEEECGAGSENRGKGERAGGDWWGQRNVGTSASGLLSIAYSNGLTEHLQDTCIVFIRGCGAETLQTALDGHQSLENSHFWARSL